ncbi:MAG: M23 family metallopeptidase [Solirubrobacterales bacterium]
MTRTDTAREQRRPRRTLPLIGSIAAAVCIGAGAASAQTPEPGDATAAPVEEVVSEAAVPEPPAEGAAPAPTDGGAEAAAGDDSDQLKARRGGGRLELLKEEASPNKIFWDGLRDAKFAYEFRGAQTADLLVEVVKKKAGDDKLVRRYREDNRDQNKPYEVRWNGRRPNGDLVKRGTFYFRVAEQGGRRLKRTNAKGDRSFKMYPAIFPVQGPHDYWDGWGAGRNHAGQDVGARCGTPMVAAEPGKVSVKAYDGAGYGYYVVIDVRGSDRQDLYGHLDNAARVGQGEHVKTGERIGQVGESGNAQGCHLHFEYRPNGSPSSAVTKKLRSWDKYS